MKDSVEKQKERISELSVVEEALARAETAGKLAVGKLLYEVTMSDESVFFAYNEKELSKEAKLAINVFANVLLAQNKDIFIEIQGHTDNIGSKEYNLDLGHDRAEAVKNYLHTEHRIPLHRMSTFSYGEDKPVVSNTNKINRSKNRRVDASGDGIISFQTSDKKHNQRQSGEESSLPHPPSTPPPTSTHIPLPSTTRPPITINTHSLLHHEFSQFPTLRSAKSTNFPISNSPSAERKRRNFSQFPFIRVRTTKRRFSIPNSPRKWSEALRK